MRRTDRAHPHRAGIILTRNLALNFGARLCNDPDCAIMRPAIGNCGEPSSFGQATIDAILAFVAEHGHRLVATDAHCPADLAEPFGVLDMADIQAFVTAFAAQDPAADFAEPFGVLDLADIQAFITAFEAGCP